MTDTAGAPAPSGEVYGEHVFSHLRPDEAERLEALAGALDENTFRRLERLPLREDWHCLEIGAGLGTTARWLAARCSRGRVVATDIDTRLFPDTGSRNGWEVREHDVTRDEFPAGSFDLVHARWVFSHLRSRDADLVRVVRWLKPGGLARRRGPGPVPAGVLTRPALPQGRPRHVRRRAGADRHRLHVGP
ncbi:hypothetical protein C3492_05150 [Streptomyces sp. Ru62]|uniref:class I SAM-dependent methyltransferase n=1 Tax=Streptomyces sp. Ru62 TaxID=2080745 RepID=UPI000CDE33E3|nr:class I SAM-dependent methyltransferase [Streptomyces sp. Ru62]POX64432.1 hypothetical protein C3492_05150 [Streptomyces sp. Ru62]